MKEIKLSKYGKNKGKYFALIDDEDFDFLNQWNWSISSKKRNIYAIRGKKINGKYKSIFMHREIIVNIENGKEIDHIDNNGLNNQKLNLRIVTHKENMNNSKNRLIENGIYLKRIRNHDWIIYYIKKDQTIILDQFDTQKEALFNIKKKQKYYLERI